MLRRLERTGYVHSKWESERDAFSEARPQRRYYEITAAGSRVLSAAVDRMAMLGAVPKPRTAR